ncbi:Histidyl-tRNA synthetase [Hordeum vulgare]|nr:Histidyl-tRNA synthetase [Hordeum vulgare]
MVAVSQCAMLRLVYGLGVLGPKEKRTTKAAEALICRFDEPLMDNHIAAIAKLVCLNARALKDIACVNGQAGEASGRPIIPFLRTTVVSTTIDDQQCDGMI